MSLCVQKKSLLSSLTMGELPSPAYTNYLEPPLPLPSFPAICSGRSRIALDKFRGTRARADKILDSSGMCKAGFAGDDAPRAVFRKPHLVGFWTISRPSSSNMTDCCFSIYCRPSSSSWVSCSTFLQFAMEWTPRADNLQHHDWHGSEGLLRR